MLKDYKTGIIDTWNITYGYNQFENADATHTYVYNRYKTIIDTIGKTIIKLPYKIELHHSFVKQFQHKFSIPTRIISKIKTAIGMR